MKLTHLPSTLLKIFVSAAFAVSLMSILDTKFVHAQAVPTVDQPLQAEFTSADMAVLEELIEIAQDNSFAVRDARYARGLSRFKDAIMIEAVLGSTSDFIHSPRHAASSNDITDTQGLTITIDPVYLISAFQQERSLIARVRETRSQTRVAVIQNYVAYVQARQAASIASRQLNVVVASLPQAPTVQVASLLQPVSLPAVNLAGNPEYVAAATESLAANGDEMMALEALAATVGLPPAETLAVIQEAIAQVQAQPIAVEAAATSESPSVAIEPAPLLENSAQQSASIAAQTVSTVSPSQP